MKDSELNDWLGGANSIHSSISQWVMIYQRAGTEMPGETAKGRGHAPGFSGDDKLGI